MENLQNELEQKLTASQEEKAQMGEQVADLQKQLGEMKLQMNQKVSSLKQVQSMKQML